MHESSMLFLIDVGKDIWATLVKRVAKRSRGVHLSTVNFVDLKFIGMICCKGRREDSRGKTTANADHQHLGRRKNQVSSQGFITILYEN